MAEEKFGFETRKTQEEINEYFGRVISKGLEAMDQGGMVTLGDGPGIAVSIGTSDIDSRVFALQVEDITIDEEAD